MKVLPWVKCMSLQNAILRRPERAAVAALDEDNVPEIEDMVSVCAGLVTVGEESDVIGLVHIRHKNTLRGPGFLGFLMPRQLLIGIFSWPTMP